MWHGTSNSDLPAYEIYQTPSKPMNAPASQIESGLEIRASALESNSNDSHIARARIVSFVTVIVGILLAANWFVCQTRNRFWEAPSVPLWQIIPSMLSISFVV